MYYTKIIVGLYMLAITLITYSCIHQLAVDQNKKKHLKYLQVSPPGMDYIFNDEKNNPLQIDAFINVGNTDAMHHTDKHIDTVYSKAALYIKKHNKSYQNWSVASVIFTWLSFILSSFIAILAGYAGQMNHDNQTDFGFLQEVFKEKQKRVQLIGVLAAIASVSSGISVKAKETSEQSKAIAMEARQKIIASYKELDEAKTAVEKKQIIENIKLITEQ